MSNTPICQDVRSRAYAIAARAGVDHRGVREWLQGGVLPRGITGERIRAVAAELGIKPQRREPATGAGGA